MSKTTTINPSAAGNGSPDRKQGAAYAAAAAVGVAAGAAGENIISKDDESDTVEASVSETVVEEVAGEVVQPEEVTLEYADEQESFQQHPIPEPEPIADPDPIPQNWEPEATVDPDNTEPELTLDTDNDNPTGDETVNPNEVADAIISEEHIDPNDIDMADVIQFDSIGTVYTVDGERMTIAEFHDIDGNNLVMIDVDGDNVFDLISDYDGNPIAGVPGNISVGDAQEDIEGEVGYLAYDDDVDDMDEFGVDDLTNDIMV